MRRASSSLQLMLARAPIKVAALRGTHRSLTHFGMIPTSIWRRNGSLIRPFRRNSISFARKRMPESELLGIASCRSSKIV